MKNLVKIIAAVILLSNCSESDVVKPEKELFFVNVKQGGTLYQFNSNDLDVKLNDAYSLACAEEFIYGKRWFSLVGKDEEDNDLTLISLGITKKVFKDELNLSDETSYVREVIRSESFGFPVDPNGYHTTLDLDNNIYLVEKGIDAEAFLFFRNGEKTFNSSTIVANERQENSYFNLEKTINLGEETSEGYSLIIEGTFRLNMFTDIYGNESVPVEGEFRWPVYTMTNSELLEVCQ